MDKSETFKIWAPAESVWTQWAKPVLFASEPLNYHRDLLFFSAEMPWHKSVQYMTDTLIIADLPEKAGVLESLSLAGLGYRPVPLYNGVNTDASYSPIVNTRGIVLSIYDGAYLLKEISLHPSSPPVFILDSNRMKSPAADRAGMFDNRWCIFPQDMPSAAFIQSQGITRVIVRSETVQYDLSHIVYSYQNKGIQIYLCDGTVIKPITVQQPSRFRSFIYRYQTISGLRRNPAGGFGGTVPVTENHTGIG